MNLLRNVGIFFALLWLAEYSQFSWAQPTLLFPADQVNAVAPLLPQSSQAQYESLLTSAGYEDIAAFSESNKYRRIGRPVGRLKVFAEDERFATCTAWLISNRHALTNQHCVDAASFPNNKIVRARLEMGVLSDKNGFDSYPVKLPQIESNIELDYAVLEVDTAAAKKYGSFILSTRDPVDAEELFLIHHPLGQPQSLSRFQCRAATPAVNGPSIRHLCNTQPGSSGSPILSDNENILVGLHHAGAPVSTGTTSRSNAGIRLSEIMKASVVLQSIAAANSGTGTTPKPVPAKQPPAEPAALQICPKKPSKSTFFAVSFDGKNAYGWYQGDTCKQFTGLRLKSILKIYIYDVGFWSGQYSADLLPAGPSVNIPVCATVLEGSAPYYSFGQLGTFDPVSGCQLHQWTVPFYELTVGSSSAEHAWRVNHLSGK